MIHLLRGCSRHLIGVSYPRITDTKLFLVLNIVDWSKDHCFYYPADDIDNLEVRDHVIKSFADSFPWLIFLMADMDIWQTDYRLLNIRNWNWKLRNDRQ